MNHDGIKLAVQRHAAVQDAGQFLADFADVFHLLPSRLQPAAVRDAVGCLVVCWLANPLLAELRLDVVAAAAGLPKPELRRQVRERAEFHTRFTELHQRDPKRTEEALCKLILA